MIKLNRVILTTKKEVEEKLENMSQIYQEEVDKAELVGREIPSPPTYKMKREDYDEEIVKYLVRPADIIDITEDADGDTVLLIAQRSNEIIVKESLEEVEKLIEESDDGK